MVKIGDLPACIDRYEATMYDNANCSGVRYGEIADDCPGGFPDLVESSNCTGTCLGYPVTTPSIDLYACSVVGVRPSGFLTWYQAKRACENVGKRLCTESEVFSACQGPDGRTYPYGTTYVGDACNAQDYGALTTVPTGSLSMCEGGYLGIFDLAGNVEEWTGSCTTRCWVVGGSYNGESFDTACGRSWNGLPDFDGSLRMGFRCCRDEAP